MFGKDHQGQDFEFKLRIDNRNSKFNFGAIQFFSERSFGLLKKTLILIMTLSLLLIFTADCLANFEPARRDYGLGWQVSSSASGFSVKIPYQNNY